MSIVSDLDLPASDYAAPDFTAGRRAELEEALAFLASRTHDLVLDGPPQPGGVEGIYGIDKLPIIWPGPPKVNPNHGPAPDV
jgi:hypothetical protein